MGVSWTARQWGGVWGRGTPMSSVSITGLIPVSPGANDLPGEIRVLCMKAGVPSLRGTH